ncbi:ligand-effect modulator 3 LEM3 family protein, putative [Ichthyophthirius multifiliis]|uniref:Ligand-effect modulator 3 LEM3 family protein, putative n=1 Tax=Ichthyophthirius multifiliis TaxID=5932 RepID=G0QND9_ICHMU|nr:ligand-effect modulator 3 LEM3 family protein, putative [Ichthyophthirius multifiliis]EGR33272.1 ligand-effect modulator 3 LEM3 family protein, putative [Ichthyophthirius multifiliis]|eukprot:XP_004037258.1 ligand-effect modulator 3 LEM3 family protein, putative [Ichthyophthirius multifiliis]
MSQWKGSNKLKAGILYILAGLYLLIAGIIFAIKNNEAYEYRVEYSSLENCSPKAETCSFQINLDQDLNPPIFIHYELKNFNQNHQIYLDNFDNSQVYQNSNQPSNPNQCTGFKTNKEINKKLLKIQNWENKHYVPDENKIIMTNMNKKLLLSTQLDDVAIPCGLRAFTYFQDTYQIQSLQDGEIIKIQNKNIAWEYDRKNIKNTKNPEKQWIDMENGFLQINLCINLFLQKEHFQNWIRPSGLSKFKKLWGRIEQKLTSGQYKVTVQNQFNVSLYDSTKSFLLGTVNSMGGKNIVLVISHLVSGSIIFVLGLFFLVYHFKK